MAGRLRAAVKWGVGTDNVDFSAFTEFDIPVVNTPRMFGEEVADLAMCYVLGLARQAFFIDRSVRSGEWVKPAGQSLRDKEIGVVGFGDIGKALVLRLKAFGVRVTVYDPVEKGATGVHLAKWPDQLSKLDYLVFTCALNQNNRNMLNTDVLAACKKGIKIVNVTGRSNRRDCFGPFPRKGACKCGCFRCF